MPDRPSPQSMTDDELITALMEATKMDRPSWGFAAATAEMLRRLNERTKEKQP